MYLLKIYILLILNIFNQMARKKRVKKTKSKKIPKKQTSLDQEIQDVESWIIERRKFFIKLGIVIILVVILITISNLYLN